VSQVQGLAAYASSLPAIIQSLINAIMPALTYAIADFEEWDDQATIVKQQTFRLYLGKQLNVVVSALTYYSIARQVALLPGVPVTYESATYSCPQDAAGEAIFNLGA
jgi:hypothetical protein